jgi:NTP pyrophosphatase (non-canonical NTP hydrolase)
MDRFNQEGRGLQPLSEAQFHTVWTRAVGQRGYDKELFQRIFKDLKLLGLVTQTDGMERLQREVGAWQEGHWPDTRPRDKISKIAEEVLELWDNPLDPEEMADVLIALLGLAEVAGVNLWQAVKEKWVVVKNRPDEYWEGKACGS